MTTKFTIPPTQRHPLHAETYGDGYLAGIDAVIAMLREPDDEIVHRIAFRINGRPQDGYDVARALADELERRKS